jgi:hypothetical protein
VAEQPDLKRDEHGHTRLHLAYYQGDAALVEQLLGYGADPQRSNRYGATPAEMAEVRQAKTQLCDLARLVNANHSWLAINLDTFLSGADSRAEVHDHTWTDTVAAETLYGPLREYKSGVYRTALIMSVSEMPRAVLKSAIKLGRPDSLKVLTELLSQYGSKDILEDYLNSGEPTLAEEASLDHSRG